MTTAMKMTGRQCRVTARKITHAATATMRIPVVAQPTLTSLLQVFPVGARCAANQRGMGRVTQPLAVAVFHDQLAETGDDAEDEHPGDHEAGGDTGAGTGVGSGHGGLRLG